MASLAALQGCRVAARPLAPASRPASLSLVKKHVFWRRQKSGLGVRGGAEVTAAELQPYLEDSEAGTLLDFHAEWCGPCKQLGPLLEKACAASGGAVRLAKVDVDAEPALAAALAVKSLPTVYVLRQGRLVDVVVGAPRDPEALRELLASAAGLGGRPKASPEVLAQLPAKTAALAQAVGWAALGVSGRETLQADVAAALGGVAEHPDQAQAKEALKIAAAYVRRAYDRFPEPISAKNPIFAQKLEPVPAATAALLAAGFKRDGDTLTPTHRNRAALDAALEALEKAISKIV